MSEMYLPYPINRTNLHKAFIALKKKINDKTIFKIKREILHNVIHNDKCYNLYHIIVWHEK